MVIRIISLLFISQHNYIYRTEIDLLTTQHHHPVLYTWRS